MLRRLATLAADTLPGVQGAVLVDGPYVPSGADPARVDVRKDVRLRVESLL